MAQVTETVARGILAGHGYTDNEVRQLAHHWLATHGQAPAQPDCLTCNDHGAVGNILTAEPCPDCTPTPQAADSALEDAARYRWLEDYLVGDRTDLDDEIVACKSVYDLNKVVDAARKQGGA